MISAERIKLEGVARDFRSHEDRERKAAAAAVARADVYHVCALELEAAIDDLKTRFPEPKSP